MSYRSAMQVVMHGTNSAASSWGVVPAASLAAGTQAPGALTGGGTVDVSTPFRILGDSAMLLLAFVKDAGTTNVQFGMQIFGADSRLVEDPTYRLKSDQTADVLVQGAPFITGTAYPLNQSSLTNVPWSTVAFAATISCALPIHFGAAPGVSTGFAGIFARLAVIVTGPVNTSVVHCEIAWSGEADR